MSAQDQIFPVWKPQWRSIIVNWNPAFLTIKSKNHKLFYQKLRNSSGGFIGRHDVREYVFKRDNYACVICDSSEDLQVDHIVSVWACTLGKISIAELNTSGNLQTLCRKCNSGKKP